MKRILLLIFACLILCLLCYGIAPDTYAAQVDPGPVDPNVVQLPGGNVTVSLNYSTYTCSLGQSFILRATVRGSGTPNLTWSSSNSDVALVSSEGNVQALEAGTAVITVYTGLASNGSVVFDPTTSVQASCTVTVTSIDGVYYIESSVTDYCLDVENTCINNFANVYMFNKASVTASKPTQLCQLWRIEYLDSGEYSIRPLHNLSMGLNVSGSDVNIISIGTTDASAVIPASARWRIRYSYGGYIFSNGSNRNVVLSVAGASTALEAQAVCQACALTNDSQIWYLTEETTTSLCPLVYDSTGHIAGTQYVAPGETRTWEDLGLTVVNYALDLSSPTITYSMSSAGHATLNLSDRSITGVSPGNTSLTLTWHIYDSSYYSQVPVEVLAITDGTYFLQNKQTSQYARGATLSNGQQVYQGTFDGGNKQRWTFTHLGNGFHSIRLPSGFYLGVESDSTGLDVNIVLRSTCNTNGTQWKITTTQSGAFKLTPKTGLATDYVLATDSSETSSTVKLIQGDYILNDSYRDEWVFYGMNGYALMYIGQYSGDPLMPPILQAVSESLANHTNATGYTNVATTKADLAVQLSTCTVFSCLTHGDVNGIHASDGLFTIQDLNTLSDSALANLDFVCLGACLTGFGGADADNFVNALHEKGAYCVLGYTVSINVTEANHWMQGFMTHLATGDSVFASAGIADLYMQDKLSDQSVFTISSETRYIAGSADIIPFP